MSSPARLSRTLVAASSCALTSPKIFSARSTSSSVRVACCPASFSLLIWISMFQIISFKRVDSRTARSTVCF